MPDPSEHLLLIVYFCAALGISFLCSLLEAVFLSVKDTYISLLIKQGKKTGLRLKELKENTDRSLAAILTLNTVAHTLGAGGVGAEVQKLYGDAAVSVASVILTFLILILSEIIPKSWGAANWRKWAPFSARSIQLLVKITSPLLVLLVWISKLSQRGDSEDKLTREEVIAAAEIGEGHGTLDEDETQVIKNLLKLDNVPAEDVMTPATVMFTLKLTDTVARVVEDNPRIRFSRIPITGNGFNDIKGIVLRSELLRAHFQGKQEATMGDILHPIRTVTPEEPVGQILDNFIKEQEHLFLVVDEYGTTTGLITLEDAIETLLGVEIVDEDDSVEDMRQLARDRLEKRRQEEEDLMRSVEKGN